MEKPIRSFGGIISNDIKDFNNSKELMKSERRHLRAYKQGKKYFTNGTKDELGELIKFKVQENWN
jgi:hypothetical protein